MNDHFGHFLVESIPRLWPLLYEKYDTVAVFCYPQPSDPKVIIKCKGKYWAKSALKMLVKNNFPLPKLHTIDRPCALDRDVYIPESAWKHDMLQFSPILRNVYAKIRDSSNKLKSMSRIFLLRDSSLRVNMNPMKNELELKTMLSELFKFESYTGDDLTFDEQVSRLSRAKILVTRPGTAAHLSVFLPEGSKLVVLEDGTRPLGHVQYKLNSLMNTTMEVIPFHNTTDSRTFNVPVYAQIFADLL